MHDVMGSWAMLIVCAAIVIPYAVWFYVGYLNGRWTE